MLEKVDIEKLANKLYQAEIERKQISQISLDYPDLRIEDAYAIQKAWVDKKIADGRRVIGHKIGLTSRAMQQSSQINEPDYGVLLDDMEFQEGSEISIDKFIVPRVEVELAFILKKDLQGPNLNLFQVMDAIDYVIPALEIIDARSHQLDPSTKRARKVVDTIADNAANAGIVLGGRAVKLNDMDLRWVGAILLKNAIIEETGIAAGVLNNPINGVLWLANKLGLYGETLKAGEIILSGSFTRPVYVERGDVISADYGPLGMVSCCFV